MMSEQIVLHSSAKTSAPSAVKTHPNTFTAEYAEELAEKSQSTPARF